MSTHLRHCPKHRKALPCPHCAFAAKPAQTPAAVAVADPVYDPKTYEEEIKKALGIAALHELRWTQEGKQDYQDIVQNIHTEILVAIKRGNEMTQALAFYIARAQVAKFIDKRIKESKTKLSFDEPTRDKEGKRSDTSIADTKRIQEPSGEGGTKIGPELEGVRTWSFSDDNENRLKITGNPRTWKQALEDRGGGASLEQLTRTWPFRKQQIAKLMLQDSSLTVRQIQQIIGIPKSTVSELRQIVLKEFEKFLRTSSAETSLFGYGRKGTLAEKALAGKFVEFLKGRGLTIEEVEALPAEKQQEIKDAFYAEENKDFTVVLTPELTSVTTE
jgi:DNA-directed RNA polymerase specialized sigma subunit